MKKLFTAATANDTTAAEFVALPLYLPAGVSVWTQFSSVGASTSASLWIGGQGSE